MALNILPKKIKIAVIFMILSGVLIFATFIYSSILTFSQIKFGEQNSASVIFTYLPVYLLQDDTWLFGFLLILFAYFLKKRKGWAWIAALILLLREVIESIYSLLAFPLFGFRFGFRSEIIYFIIIYILFFISVLLSLIFLILDRKKYWEIAS